MREGFVSVLKLAILIGVGLMVTAGIQQKKETEQRRHNQSPKIQSFTSSSRTVIHCPRVFGFACSVVSDNEVRLNTTVENPRNTRLTYAYVVTGGRIVGEGPSVFWNLEDAPLGQHTATVSVENQNRERAVAAVTIDYVECTSCDPPPPPCPMVTVDCPSEIEKGKLVDFVATVTGGGPDMRPSYTWTTNAGKIVSGKYERKLTVDLLGFPFEKVTATLSAGGADPSCTGTTVSCTTTIKQ